ncbi:phospholipase [Paenibacillus xerothermodurans]|uniref:phospholipase D n=2 Tax=Paenibacillus xerothermodurans TaxID=1977292 RepID=A0A2W1NWR1_PAEXE|nr:phospholipase [Paenibacillus xerothermodurans]
MPQPHSWRSRFILLLLALVILYSGVIAYHAHKPLPAGLSMQGPVHHVQDVNFLYDLTYKNPTHPTQQSMIFERIFRAVEEAQQFIVVDMFLFNSYHKEQYPPLSGMLADKLIAQKQKYPDMHIVVITDEVNTFYGSARSPELDRLKAAGIQTYISDVNPLRDSTPLYSGLWRMFVQWFGQPEGGWLPNPMVDTAPPVTLRSYLKLLNVKANHRKVIATENILIIPSANAHDASAYNSNAAFAVNGDIINDALASEAAVPVLSGTVKSPRYSSERQEEGNIEVRLLTEGRIGDHVLASLAEAEAGDKVWLGMFYLAEPKVLDALVKASRRGAEVRLILDPNQNAFGRDKIGLPNRPAAQKLLESSGGNINIRWYNTTKEQYHTKLLFIDKNDRIIASGGSANFTARNLNDLNLETNLAVAAPGDSGVAQELRDYFTRIWNNDGAVYTLDYAAYHEETVWVKRMLYELQEWLGLTTY